MGGSRSRAIGATLFFLGATVFSGTAADGADGFDTLDFFESIASLDPPSLSCNMQTLFSLRLAWDDVGDVCNRKLPFEFWIYMKAEGSAKSLDADHVRKECLMSKDVGVVELITPEDWDKTTMDAAPGKLIRETKRAASYLVESPLDFEAMCIDDQVKKVSRIIATTAKATAKAHEFRPQKFNKHLRNTKDTAEVVHAVGALISGLEKLGCQRTTGEEQTLCIMSDSFNQHGSQFLLQESGDLPPDEFLAIVKDLPEEIGMGLDEGIAMTLLAYGIARGANFKFNTMLMGKATAADDIRHLATHEDKGGEGCDIILDDISLGDEPEFRKGVVAKAVEEAVATGSLYFSSTGNFRNGYKFTSHWECAPDLYGEITSEPCDNGVASHVFNPEAEGIHRYLLPLDGTSFSPGGNTFFLHWDDDEGTSRSVVVELWSLFEVSGEEYTILARFEAVSDFGAAMVSLTLPEGAAVGDLFYLTISQVYSDQDNVEMRLTSWTDKIFSDCYNGSRFAHPCAPSTGGVAATSNWGASGDGGAFAHPEVSFVDTRLKTVNTAATDLVVPTDISVVAPVAAAITAIIRSACFPRVSSVVTQIDMIKILTDNTYTFDATSDAHGTKETWEAEPGDGNISVDQILGWVAANCQESCPGSVGDYFNRW